MTKGLLYASLELSPTATASDIRTAYRLLAMKFHPAHHDGLDKMGRFLRVSAAYSLLADGDQRRLYDEQEIGKAGAQGLSFAQLSPTQAERIFAKEMSALAWELADAGYDHAFIERALTEEGCPVAIAAAAARSTVLSAGGGSAPQAAFEPRVASPLPHTRPAWFRNRWGLAGAALFAGLLLYALAYRPYVTAKEEEAKRIAAERELAAATAARMAAEALARAAEQVRMEERVRQEARNATLAHEDQRQRAKDAAARQAEYQACLARLGPAAGAKPMREASVQPARAPFAANDGGVGAIMTFKVEQWKQNSRRADEELRIKAEAVCQGILSR